ncbi:septal ring lytic transglycosylase RlpA family protein [Hirschia litorea]|uniref:Endolytic peptidoglycan transglycosylase RlpA n=1 Tax=Hirschia litorea TaxID=1199156 RepID=A0ABW2IHH4_9PROT
MAIATLHKDAVRLGSIRSAVICTASMLSLVIVPNAIAEKQSAAPISFANANSPKQANYRQYASAPVQSASVQGGAKRIEYRYPDQPNMAYGANGPRHLSAGAQPIAFASSTSAVTQQQAQQLSGSKYIPPRQIARDPALTAGAFDARAAAQHASMHSAPTIPSEPPPGYAKQKIGAPYEISGRWYVPFAEPNYDEVGIGSWYGPQFHGKPSATGETFDQFALTAAHPTLPIPSLARVTNIENGRSVVVRINDRGPFVDDRIIDMSKQAASVLGYHEGGTAKVRVQYMGFAPEAENTIPAIYVEEARRTLAKAAAVEQNQQPKLTKVSFMEQRPQSQNIAALPPAPRRTFPTSTTNASFALQVGAFGELANAHKMRAKLHGYGDVSLKEARINGRDIFKVYVDGGNSRSKAEQIKTNLKASGFDSLIVTN